MMPTRFDHPGYDDEDILLLKKCFNERKPYFAKHDGKIYKCKVVSMEFGEPWGLNKGWFPYCDYLFELEVVAEVYPDV